MKVKLLESTFDPWEVVRTFQNECFSKKGEYGATSVFVGTMRELNEGDQVTAMQLECYPEMTLKHLKKIALSAMNKFDILDIAVLHRVGEVLPNQPIVCLAVWSVHRAAAYDANRYVMEHLKSKVPFWKKEKLVDSERWVKNNTQG